MTDGAALLFSRAPNLDGALLFGDDEATPDVEVTLDLALPGLVIEASIAHVVDATVDIELPGLVVDVLLAPLTQVWADIELPSLVVEVELSRNLDVSRPTVSQVRASAQSAQPLAAGVREHMQAPKATPAGFQDRASSAVPIEAGVTIRQAGTLTAERQAVRAPSQDAVAVAAGIRLPHQEMLRDRRPSTLVRSQDAVPLRASVRARSQDMLRDRRPSVRAGHQEAVPTRAGWQSRHQVALPAQLARRARSQDAVKPPIGISVRPEPPTREPCYLPNGALLFAGAAAVDGALVFICERHSGPGPVEPIVIPVRRVYMVINSVALVRVSDGARVKADSITATLDVDSWSWGFTIALPDTEFGLVEPTLAGPVELLATINGMQFRILAEDVDRDRAFKSNTLRVVGRGRIAELDDPYAMVLSFGNSGPLTAQQLIADALTDNGIPLGWTVGWGIDDWLVPAGIWSHRGTYISAVNTIAKAAGAYLRPHASAKSFDVLHRYPAAPWEWGDVTPDLVLPAAVARRETKSWKTRPAYNRVFVAPQNQGLQGYEVTRDGTAGELVAPLVVDSLMTDVAAVRQRARFELGQGGRQVMVGLGLPVLAEMGVVLPGTFVQYEDGAGIVRGIVRSTSIESAFPNVWQTIGVETRV